MKYKIHYIKSFLIVLSLFLIDFISKLVVKSYGIRNVFLVNYLENTGIVFGVFQGNNLIFIILSMAVIFAILHFYSSYGKLQMGFNLILAGALGNLLDRLCYGYVIDFIDLRYWPVFNLADVFIVAGVLIVVYKMVWHEK